jgi:hypothetical protein
MKLPAFTLFPPLLKLRRDKPAWRPESFRGWARQDSNLGPRDYESPALPLSYRPEYL